MMGFQSPAQDDIAPCPQPEYNIHAAPR